jgi:hypothetical protein
VLHSRHNEFFPNKEKPTTSILSNAMFAWNVTSRRMFYLTMRATFAKNAIHGKTQITS